MSTVRFVSHWSLKMANLFKMLFLSVSARCLARFQRAGRMRSSSKGKPQPEKFSVSFDNRDELSSQSEESDDGIEGDESLLEVGCEALERDEEIRLHVMGLSSYWTLVVESNWASNLKELPTRYLPPGSIRMLYQQMSSENNGGLNISYQTFWKTFREYWGKQLRFLPPSTHGTCDSCCAFKSEFKACRDPQAMFEISKHYKMHLDQVSADRDLEEYLQVEDPLRRPGAALAVHWETTKHLEIAKHFSLL